ncbi:MAG: FecCD family ABC transporter permease [Spirochaetaceae bacterium]
MSQTVTRRAVALTVALIAAVVALGFSLARGTIAFAWQDVPGAALNRGGTDLANQVIHNIRLPRALNGLMVGMNLAVSGTILQAVLRNPLASPNIIGVSNGAGLAAVALMVLLPGRLTLIPPAAFVGALAASGLVYGISRAAGSASPVQIVLSGVAVSAFLGALTSGLMVLHSDELDVTYSWLLGGLSGRGWSYVGIIWPYSIVGLTLVILLTPQLNLFVLGDEVGSSLGLRVPLFRFLFLGLAAVLAGSAISVAGTVGFIGLIAPHAARLMVGEDYRFMTPLAALTGGVLLVLADLAARVVFQPVELPVGVLTAALGAPFFLLLLTRRRTNSHST